MEPRDEPAEVEVVRDRSLTITFHDGYVARFDLEPLRRGCPCAECRGRRDRGEPAWPRRGSPLELTLVDAAFHGAWGLALVWNDGHGTGIYPFAALRRWSEGGPAFPPDSGLGGAE